MNFRRRYAPLAPEELEEILVEGPTERAAFLPAKSNVRTVAETIAAMANSTGGLVLLGVTTKGSVQADNDVRALAGCVADAVLMADPPLILPSAQSVDTDKGAVVAVQVPLGLPHIYSLQGLYLTRTGDQNRPLTTPELRRLMLERGETGFERHPVPGATLDDLDDTRIRDYLDDLTLAPGDSALQELMARGCITLRDGAPVWTDVRKLDPEHLVPTVAGILLFGRNPQRFVASAEIICVRYATPSMSDEFVRQDIKGTLAEQIRMAEAFLVSNMRRGMRISGMARQESAEYPVAVVREAIVNAVAHRDYSIRGEGIRLLMFSDRLELYSPGRLPGHVTLANLKDERYSRNEAIVAVLSDVGYIERLGYGIDRMIATMQEAGLPEPQFEEMSAGFKVTLRSGGDELVSSRPEEQRWMHGYLNERQERALAFLQDEGRITNSDYQQLCPDVSAETIRRDLADLVEKNLIIRIGTKRATYYILK